ncbi:hypothetical protein ABMA27_010728 [Loxostege sticticalis]|uniref:RNA-directed DNA polymerase n=1 Tax=Loxostege sticticalis TaxID=481309 RepID=A0ABR3H472_LOXSC
MFIADYLSRNFLRDNLKVEPSLQELVHSFETELAISERRLENLRKATLEDTDLCKVIEWYKNGFPKSEKEIVNANWKQYYRLKDDLHVKNDILYFRDRIIIPKSMKNEILKCLHQGHVGIVKCKINAKKTMFWLGMSRDIEMFVLSCSLCEKYRNSNPKQTLIPHDIPNVPFYKIGMDICTFGKRDYLVVVDYFSKWIEVKTLISKTAQIIINKLKVIFATHGIPKYIVSDNMPFSSLEFKQFANNLDIELLTSSPRYPQSNGMSEKAVGIVKKMMRKCFEENSDINLALLNYRSSPVAGLNYSPAELLMSRSLRTTLPCTESFLKPKLPNDVYEQMNKSRDKTKEAYNRNAVTRKSFVNGENVRIQNRPDKVWYQGKVVGQEGQRSYWVKKEEGNVVRRNERHMLHSRNNFIDKPRISYSFGQNETQSVGPNVTSQRQSVGPNVTSQRQSVGPNVTSQRQSVGPNVTSQRQSVNPNVTSQSQSVGSNVTSQFTHDQSSSGTDYNVLVSRYGRVIKKPKRFLQ